MSRDAPPASQVYLEVAIGGTPAGRVTIDLFDEVAPKTCANFRALCAGGASSSATGTALTYKGSPIHRVIPGFMIQGGDFTKGDGTGGESIYGGKFADESFALKHGRAGVLSMANAGPNINGSQFFITLAPTPHLDGKHVVFGRVASGMEVARAVERVETDARDRPAPLCRVVIVDCGVVAARKGARASGDTKKEKKRRKAEDEEESSKAAKKRRKKELKAAKKAEKKQQKKDAQRRRDKAEACGAHQNDDDERRRRRQRSSSSS